MEKKRGLEVQYTTKYRRNVCVRACVRFVPMFGYFVCEVRLFLAVPTAILTAVEKVHLHSKAVRHLPAASLLQRNFLQHKLKLRLRTADKDEAVAGIQTCRVELWLLQFLAGEVFSHWCRFLSYLVLPWKCFLLNKYFLSEFSEFKELFSFLCFFSNQMETCQTFKCWSLLFAT